MCPLIRIIFSEISHEKDSQAKYLYRPIIQLSQVLNLFKYTNRFNISKYDPQIKEHIYSLLLDAKQWIIKAVIKQSYRQLNKCKQE